MQNLYKEPFMELDSIDVTFIINKKRNIVFRVQFIQTVLDLYEITHIDHFVHFAMTAELLSC